MLVMDENWLIEAPELMGQFSSSPTNIFRHHLVDRQRFRIQNTDIGRRIAQSLGARLQQLDPTRLWTYAANNGNKFEGINSVVPVRGFNYLAISDIDRYRRDHPDQILLGSEEASTFGTRGVYANDTIRGYISDYDKNIPGHGSLAESWWKFYDAREWLAGAFAWTGFDYRGEPAPYTWPCINSHFGIMAVCGFPKNNFYYYKAWWSGRDVLHLYPHWNWRGREGKFVDVWCQSTCETVNFFLNGRPSARTMERNGHWNGRCVPTGTLKPAVENGGSWRNGWNDRRAGEVVLTPDRGPSGQTARM
jgi:beta-galactosidase